MERLALERGPIRPPSEAKSLLIRATRNCPWNRCAFCHTYHGEKFGIRNVEEVGGEIRRAGRIAERLQEAARLEGSGDRISQQAVNRVYGEGEYAGESIRSVAAWLHQGGESVFIQDADSLVMKTDDLVRVISCIRETFPQVSRITSYCRSRTALRKTSEELRRLREAGLVRVHVGLESGCDEVLTLVHKGVTAAEQAEGCRKLKEAGLSLCTYVMPGLGGSRWSVEHARETAALINRIDPEFVRLRTLHVVEGCTLRGMLEKGEFRPLPDEEIVGEIRAFIQQLQGIGTMVVSDHILNLLEEVEGKLPEDRDRMLAIMDRFFSHTPEERLVFRVGRRKGLYRRLDNLADRETFQRIQDFIDQCMRIDSGLLEQELNETMDSFI
jgi:hypothetical protein